MTHGSSFLLEIWEDSIDLFPPFYSATTCEFSYLVVVVFRSPQMLKAIVCDGFVRVVYFSACLRLVDFNTASLKIYP